MQPLIVCADDDADILSLISLRLERAGFRVVQAVDGDSALEAVRAHRPTLAVLDVMMPRRTGYEVLATLRADPTQSGLKVILLSARVDGADIGRGIDEGADAYVTKPFKASTLVAKVEELLAREG